MLLPIVTPPHENELLFSWAMRLCEENALEPRQFWKTYLGKGDIEYLSKHKCDMRDEYMPLLESINMEEYNPADLFLSLSTINFESLFLRKEIQTKYINSVFRPLDKFNTQSRALFPTLKVCPECMKEDKEHYGHIYYHREHHLSGVCMCPRHHVKLLVNRQKHFVPLQFKQEDFVISEESKPEEVLAAYADYAQNLLVSNIHSDIGRVKTAIADAFDKRGYRTKSKYNNLYEDLKSWRFNELLELKQNPFNKIWMSALSNKPAHIILTLLMFLYPDPQDLIARVKDEEPLIRRYECSKCGNVYYGTQMSDEMGWGCPKCDQQLSYDERYMRIVKKLGNDEYKITGPFISCDKTIPHYHSVCGQTTNITPYSYMFEGRRCSCRIRLPEDDVRHIVEMNPGFTLVSYINASKKMTISHSECGGLFEVTKREFIRGPYCRCCDPRNKIIGRFKSKIHDLVGNEYTFLNYDEKTKKFTLLHTCGDKHSFYPTKFFHGQRCPQCTEIPSYDKLDTVLSEASNGKYLLDGLVRDGRDVVVKNTDTGVEITMTKELISQELSRQTPSPILPGVKTGYQFETWDDYLRLYREYCQRYNTNYIARGIMYKGVDLWPWCRRMRMLNQQGKLSAEKKQLLDKAEFPWMAQIEKLGKTSLLENMRQLIDNDPDLCLTTMRAKVEADHKQCNTIKEKWKEKYDLYVEYCCINGTQPKAATVYRDVHIGQWCTKQRRYYRNGKLNQAQVELLAAAEFKFAH